MQAAAPQPPRPVPPKKSNRGCLIALAIVGGVGFVIVAVAAFGIYRFANSSQGKMVFGTIGDVAELAAEAQHAPGTKEVRALGCDTAMAMDMDRMTSIMHERLDASSTVPSEFSMLVVCQLGMFSSKSPPTCDDVASTYVSAAGPPARGLAVNVQRGSGRANTLCSTLYDSAGTKVKDLTPGTAPTVPGAK